MAFDLETNWDWASVEYTINGGQTWSTLGRKTSQPNWYNSDLDGNNPNGDCYGCPGAQWTGRNTTLRQYAYNFATNAANGETDLTGADHISFRARFGGVPMDVSVPSVAIMAIYAKENGQGMVFGSEAGAPDPDDPPPPPGKPEKASKSDSSGSGRPSLKVVK